MSELYFAMLYVSIFSLIVGFISGFATGYVVRAIASHKKQVDTDNANK